MADSKLTIGYWGIQGLAHPVRLLLSYFKVPFEEVQYLEKDEWFGKDKPALKSWAPSIPYIKDGEVVLTESLALTQYAAGKCGNSDLLGKNDIDQIRVFQLWSIIKDLGNAYIPIVWKDDFETIKDETIKTKVVPILAKLSKALGEQEYPLGYLTWADFWAVFFLDTLVRMSPEVLKDYPNLQKYHDRIYANEGIQAYRKSEKYPKLFMPPYAKWAGEEKI